MLRKLKIPRYIIWMAQVGIVFLLLMTFLRWLLVILFTTSSTKHISLKSAYWLGFRFDLRVISVLMMLLFLIANIPSLHPINKKWGRRVAITIWTIFIVIFSIFYAVDFVNYAYLQQRLNAGVLNFLQDANISFGTMWQNYHLGWNILALIACIALLIWIVNLSYNFTLSQQNVSTKKSSFFWATIFVVLLSYGIVGKIVAEREQFLLSSRDAYNLENDYAANIAFNPFQSFFSMRYFKNATFNKN